MVTAASKSMIEIRWHARAGQGAVTAAKLTAEAALAAGMHFQAFPEYGPERTGAPIQAFTRLSQEPIFIHANVEQPSVVVILDPTLLGLIDVTTGVPDDGVYIINTEWTPAEARKNSGIKNGTIHTVDASGIAMETIKRPIPNTPMLGALISVTHILELEIVIEDMKKSFAKKFSQAIIDANVEAVERSYKEVKGE